MKLTTASFCDLYNLQLLQGFREIRLRELQHTLGDSNPAVARFMEDLAVQARHCRKEIVRFLKTVTRPSANLLDTRCWHPMFRMREVVFGNQKEGPLKDLLAEINDTTGSIYRRVLDQAAALPGVISSLLSQQHSDLMKASNHFPMEPESRT